MPSDDATLLDIWNAGRGAIEFKGDSDKAAFMADRKTQSAVLHQLLIIGEAVKRLSPGFREKHPEIPWKQIAGTRDKIIHEYNNVDLDEVWRTLTADVPRLLSFLPPFLPRTTGE